jgi:hypothetical protein
MYVQSIVDFAKDEGLSRPWRTSSLQSTVIDPDIDADAPDAPVSGRSSTYETDSTDLTVNC